jgi:myo-inositol-1(or 4)-monophosphatase
MGSVAYKLARVAAGLADITFTLTPKHEWDEAAGAALVVSGGGFVQTLNSPLACNRENPLLDGLIACGPLLKDRVLEFLAPYSQLVSGK